MSAKSARIQVSQMHTSETVKVRNAIRSSHPCRIAANDTCSVERMKTTPPAVRQNEASASVGGRDGRILAGGRRNLEVCLVRVGFSCGKA